MDNKLPVEVKKYNIFKRILKFLKGIFKKHNDEVVIKDNNELINLDYESKENNIDYSNQKLNVKKNAKEILEEIIKIVEKSPTILENLDIAKLEIIDSYYKHKITECKRKIKKEARS